MAKQINLLLSSWWTKSYNHFQLYHLIGDCTKLSGIKPNLHKKNGNRSDSAFIPLEKDITLPLFCFFFSVTLYLRTHVKSSIELDK